MSDFAAVLTLIASGLTLFAFGNLLEGRSIAKDGYLLIPVCLGLAILTGSLISVLLQYLVSVISVILFLCLLGTLEARFSEGIPLPTLLWGAVVELWHLPTIIRTSRNPPTFQDDLEQAEQDTDKPVDKIRIFDDQ